MASLTASSARSRSFRSGGEDGHNSSPIPYHERPSEYMPTVMCKCSVKAARFILWSDLNPARRYLKCTQARFGGCNFWVWYDCATTPFLKQVLVDLRDAVRGLRRENAALQGALVVARRQVEEGAAQRCVLEEMEKACVELAGRVAKLENERKMMLYALAFCIGMIVVCLCRP